MNDKNVYEEALKIYESMKDKFDGFLQSENYMKDQESLHTVFTPLFVWNLINYSKMLVQAFEQLDTKLAEEIDRRILSLMN